ncbi:hypothetical protein BASA81_003681 [Batrachochytrium salamandrivorans]|nr:hypothetical protein BASA81_003681 [Batrachochytrium salamandrivorans]
MEAVDAQELNAVRTDYDSLTQEEKLFLGLRSLPNVCLVVPAEVVVEEEVATEAATVLEENGQESNGMREDYRLASPEPSAQSSPPASSATPQFTGSAPKRAKLKVRRTAEDL